MGKPAFITIETQQGLVVVPVKPEEILSVNGDQVQTNITGSIKIRQPSEKGDGTSKKRMIKRTNLE